MQRYEPYYAEDTDGVHFQVDVDGRLVQAFLGRTVIAQIYGAVARGGECIDAYLAHRAVVDSAVVRRVRTEGPETVLLRSIDLAPDGDPNATGSTGSAIGGGHESLTGSRRPLRDRDLLALALCLLAVLTAIGLWARPLTPIDETRYIGVAWEMWVRGDFLVPFKNGQPYSDKPPLLMWLYQLGWGAFGVNELWPRLVSPLCAALSLAMTCVLARRLWPEQRNVGGYAALILAGTLLWQVFATAAMFDVLLASLVLLAMLGITGAVRSTAARNTDLPGFAMLGFAIGFGILCKGPIILLHTLPVALLAPWWQRPHNLRRWYAGIVLAVLFGVALALGWAVPAGLRGGDAYRHAIFWGQTANRMIESFAHRHPFWWYLPLLPLALFPWSLCPGCWRGLACLPRERLDTGSRFCLAWCVPVFVALSLISGKQPHYLVPLLPPFALLLARTSGKAAGGPSWVPVSGLLVGVILVVAAFGRLDIARYGVGSLPALWPGLALCLVSPALWILARYPPLPIAWLALFGAVFMGLAQLSLSPVIRAGYDVSVMANAIQRLQASGVSVANAGKYHDQFHFAGHLQQPLHAFDDDKQLEHWLTMNPHASAVLYLSDASRLDGENVRAMQPYRGGFAALLDAPVALKFLYRETGSLAGRAKSDQP